MIVRPFHPAQPLYRMLAPPGTLVTYQIALAAVVDFRDGYKLGEWDIAWQDWDCEWRRLAFNLRIEPPSWLIGDLVISANAVGILFPSTLPQAGTNLVVFTQRLTTTDKLEHFDPRGDLPRNQRSWDPPAGEYVIDGRGLRTAVAISLKKHRILWEDMFDSYLAEARRSEPRETLAAVKRLVGRRAARPVRG